MKFYHLDRIQILPLPLDQAFAFFADPRHLEASTPPFVHFKFTREPPAVFQAGSVVDYRVRMLGVPFRWQARIELWEPPHRFVDIQVKGLFASWHHTHLFEDAGDGHTRMRDRIEFAMPMGALGRVAYRLFVARTIERIFDVRAEHLAALLTPASDR